jgi:hypothetical protein
VEQLPKDGRLAALRERSDFQKRLTELGAKSKQQAPAGVGPT